MTTEELVENFALFEDWEDRYRYIIDLGKKLPNLPQADRNDQNRVEGCVSQVWLTCEEKGGKYFFKADSDAFIVKGLASILITIYSGKSEYEIKQMPIEDIFAKLDLGEHLSPTRRNGFFAMVQKIQSLSHCS
jgi:cysteine desulfuration protein SufE